MNHPQFQAFTRKAYPYPMTANADGTFEAEDVPAGTYSLSAFAILQAAPGKSSFDSLSAPTISVIVPADSPTGQEDAGILEMRRSAQ